MTMLGEGFNSTRIPTGDIDIHVTHGGAGDPLLLLHGYPQTHVMWHAVAPQLVNRLHVICPDLRGYGDSEKPAGSADHANYAKRVMARDMVEVMRSLGYDRFFVAGHDRGARVTHRMALDYPDAVRAACVMDIVPTAYMFEHVDRNLAEGYYHWFFLIQPDALPERLIGADPAYYLREKLRRWSAGGAQFNQAAIAEYIRCFSDPAAIHASCEDYRAAATIDILHDAGDRNRKIQCPLLVLWGRKGFVHRNYDVMAVWQQYSTRLEGRSIDCGHFLPEEAPDAVRDEMLRFFRSR